MTTVAERVAIDGSAAELCSNCRLTRHMAELGRPKRGAIKARLLELIELAGPTGLTVDDLERVARLGHQSVSARVHELARRGLIIAAGRRTNPSGKTAIAWRARPFDVNGERVAE